MTLKLAKKDSRWTQLTTCRRASLISVGCPPYSFLACSSHTRPLHTRRTLALQTQGNTSQLASFTNPASADDLEHATRLEACAFLVRINETHAGIQLWCILG